ncbi:MAG: iron-containing alcohol dehydrogenase [bacterium]|nr:iron-containing alcohol dehydrogenase [bacterium]
MLDFLFHTPTKIFFGKNQLNMLGEDILSFGQDILLLYGKGSIKKNGVFDAVIAQLKKHGIHYVELGGVDPNPRISTVREGARLCRENNLKLILAVGGGSTIDCAKAISFAACYDGDPWDFWAGKTDVTRTLPIGTVLTLAATGSEMNKGTVITNADTEEKRGKSSPLFFPKFSILDPTLTFSVPPLQTAAGVVDIMTHVYESYFSPVTTAFLQDSFAEGIVRTCIKYGPVALREPDNYEARANLMWAGSMALNGVVARGKTFDGTLHGVEHAISGLYDLTHGVGLAILAPQWFEYVLDEHTLAKFVRFAKHVWGVEGADDGETARMGIEQTKAFYKSLEIPLTLAEVGIGSDRFDEILDRSLGGKTLGVFKKLNRQDLLAILTNCL